MLLLESLKVFAEDAKDAAFKRLFYDASELGHLKLLLDGSQHFLNLIRHFRVSRCLLEVPPDQTAALVISRLKCLRNLVLQFHDSLTLVKQSVLMHATSLVKQSLSELTTVVFAASELLREMEVFDLPLCLLCHISQSGLQILGVFETRVRLIHYNDGLSV